MKYETEKQFEEVNVFGMGKPNDAYSLCKKRRRSDFNMHSW